MRLTTTMMLSLDGVVQGPGAPDEDTRDGFTQGGWVFPFADEDFGAQVAGQFARAEAFLLGRRTYEIFAGYWPRVTDPADPVAGPLNALPKYVASRGLREADWAGTTVLSGDLATEVAALRERPGGELQVHGSPELVRSLMAHDLIDEYRLAVFPVVLGNGRRLFTGGSTPTALRLTDTTRTASGVVLQTYEPAGRPTYGSFGPPE